ncbi:uncharacterized protein LOC110855727 [Folsomia candida]|uniref:uncharacterized protein LOC110855727 n=1 Tax=Folsomia candida TaxID=158441 RepID=UPI001604C86F|nr:uncharacterized protein LOC110855727 [Folsomia candida]XP_035712281.1 uncharacterized protein LOC110855727 [Folsomia candida]XP_035712282.1 uncharacterized protein LOC110855727 [Folsomia candida]
MICSNFIFLSIILGEVLQSCKAIEGFELEDGNVPKIENALFERLDTKLSNLPTKHDIAALDKTGQILKNELATLSKKLDRLQGDFEYLKSRTDINDNHGYENNNRRIRRSIKVPDFVASDYRLGILISEIQNTSLHESCKFVEQLVAVEKDQFAILEEIRNTTSEILQTKNLSSPGSSKSYLNNTNPSISPINTVGTTKPRNRQQTTTTVRLYSGDPNYAKVFTHPVKK